ncbi:glycoside hydrolase family 3 protein [Pseudodesulfovibrio sp.]|uniref:glycoside hydrolase family 3 protein n=1 Tax=Pseudodesulfovibrio sp. TaxID=2035812 RepID=UPI00260410CE|nr:glycoside hydrolase family 3 protein [Pseudodesulfovibrio sp.]MDD3313329.1 glycoside hydrolase family 3 protein [Pseudodesulfovibrio sp.]
MFLRRLLPLLALVLLLAPRPAVAAADLDVMIGQMIMAGFRGYTVDENSPIMRDIRERHLGGVVLFDRDMTRLVGTGRNIESPAQVRKLIADLQKASYIPLLVAVDQEGGMVQRLKKKYGFTETPSAAELGKSPDEAVSEAGRTVGETLALSGFNVDFAPVADVNVNPESPAIGKLGRSFSADPERVAKCDELFLEGLAERGVVGCLKHFPGHGSAGEDSHQGLTDVSSTWSGKELIPYERLIGRDPVKMIMTAHIFNATLDSEYPATLSKAVITGLLRGKLGFDGVVVTDDMNMRAITEFYGLDEAVRRAIDAGADILLFGNNITYDPEIVPKVTEIIRNLVERGDISEARVRQSYERILRLKRSLEFPGGCPLCRGGASQSAGAAS